MAIKQVYATYDRTDAPAIDGFAYCPRCQTPLAVQAIDHRSRSACPACGFIHFRNPAPAVSVLIVKDDQVVLGRRSGEPGKGLWATPSGYIEFEDDFLATARQEAHEETGLEVEIRSILNVSSYFFSPRYHFLAVYVLARVTGGELAAGDDLETVAWFPLAGPFPELAFEEDADILEAYSQTRFEGLPLYSASSATSARRG